MNFKEILVHLLKKDTPDEEELGAKQPASRATPPQNTTDPEKMAGDAGASVQNGGTTDNIEDDDDDIDSEHENREYENPLTNFDSDAQPTASPHGLRSIASRIWSSLRPSPSNEEEIQAYIPHYRVLPIMSGIIIPFCILLEIPGLTEQWYIHTEGSTIEGGKSNTPLLDVGIALSILCALAANICLVIRFLERRIKTMTILCTLFLSLHDMINVAALAAFGGTKGNFTYGQAFWMTLCSTIVSAFTNVTLIIDLIRTPDFKRSGSGLTRRQRSLVIIIIGLFCYIALGALVNSLLLDLTFINGLYFTVVTIETIGFGDIVPDDRGSRVFICFYATLGVINLAFVVGYVRETVLEGLDFGYRRRLLAIQERRRAATRRKRAEHRWRHAVAWRLRGRHVPVWIPSATKDRGLWSKFKSAFWGAERVISLTARRGEHKHHRHHGMELNLWALPRCQLEAAALEAGVPLDTLLPNNFYDTYDQDACQHDTGEEHHAFPPWFAVHPVYHRDERVNQPLTHNRLGSMAVMLTRFSFSVYESGGSSLPDGGGDQDASGPGASSGSLQTSSSEGGDYRTDVEDSEKKAYYTRSGLSWSWFLIFWMGGALIFKFTEGWTYGSSVYFCFISFTTIGYGDLAPTTPAGRSIFVVWALVGVATMTIFISVVSEAYTSRYKGILGRNNFKRVIQQYHNRTKVELNEKVERMGTSAGVKFDLRGTTEGQETTEVVEHESPMAGTTTTGDDSDDDGETSGAIASTSKAGDAFGNSHVHEAQRSLERLPQQVLTETQAIQQYMRLAGDLDDHSMDKGKGVDGTVRRLVDDVMSGRNVSECTKMDILKDGTSRQMLMMLGIERSLKELVNISEQAMVAVRERDRVIVALGREKKQDRAGGRAGGVDERS